MGFAVPLATWLREELKDTAQDHLFNRTAGLVDYFKPEAIQSMWSTHQAGSKDLSSPLWSMLMFQMWWDKYMDTKHA